MRRVQASNGVVLDAADKHIDEIAETLDQALLSPELGKVREALTALSKRLGERYSVTLTCLVEVFDGEKERNLPLLSTGLSTSGGAGPHAVSGDSTRQRYLVDGEIQVVPHDRCPKCWELWDFKWEHRRCGPRPTAAVRSSSESPTALGTIPSLSRLPSS
jgi:hypothetical protein